MTMTSTIISARTGVVVTVAAANLAETRLLLPMRTEDLCAIGFIHRASRKPFMPWP